MYKIHIILYIYEYTYMCVCVFVYNVQYVIYVYILYSYNVLYIVAYRWYIWLYSAVLLLYVTYDIISTIVIIFTRFYVLIVMYLFRIIRYYYVCTYMAMVQNDSPRNGCLRRLQEVRRSRCTDALQCWQQACEAPLVGHDDVPVYITKS